MKIFLSAVSGQFRTSRSALASDLRAVGAEVAVQDDFQQQGRTLLEKLENYIAGCDRVIALVGDAYGWEPESNARPPDTPRRSYTQWEYFFAEGERLDGTRQQAKDLFVYFATPEFLNQSPVVEAVETAELQQQFVTYIRSSGKDYSSFGSLHELRALVLRDGFRLAERTPRSPNLHDYAGRIQNFLDEYLGTPTSPVPFGGRERQLEALDDWLTDPSSPPYALIAAEAGRGKSALLAHWTKSILDRDLTRVIFIPVSIRFNTALSSVIFKTLAARLAEIYDEPIVNADLSAEQWRSMCLSYMRRSPPKGRTLLVILDGLDEASDWHAGPDQFPVLPPSGLRVLVSARYLTGDADERGWLRRLGWDPPGRARSIPLPPLTRRGVGDVLQSMGNPMGQVATDVDLVGELFRLSQGDPLLVRLYVEALSSYGQSAAALKPEDLPSIQDGLAGYFERWWDDQARRLESQGRAVLAQSADVRDFLDVCATALGPLSRDDISGIVGGSLASGLRLREIAREVDRFVIGDGRARGYVFSHPRLGQFFWEQMTGSDHAKWESRFLEYGRRTLEELDTGQIAPGEAPYYIVQYYGTHLERAGGPAKNLYALVTEGWLKAWETLEGTYAGFLNDIERVWRSAESSSAPVGSVDISILLKCALCRSSIAALSVNIPTELLVLCVQNQILTPLQVLIIARQSPDPLRYSEAISQLAPHLPSGMMGEVLTEVRAIKDDHGRATAFIALAPLVPNELKAEVTQEALSAIAEARFESDRVSGLTALAPHLSEASRLTAIALASEIDDPEERALALTTLGSALQEPKRAEVEQHALDAARDIEDDQARTDLLIALVPNLREALKAEVVQEALAMALQLPEDSYLSGSPRAAAIANLAPHLGEAMKAEALEAAGVMQNIDAKVEALTGLAPYLPESLKRRALREALEAIEATENKAARVQPLIRLAPFLPEGSSSQVFKEAFEEARAIQDVERRPITLSSLAPYLPRELLGEALAAAATEDGWARATILVSLAPSLPEELLTEALSLAKEMGSDGSHLAAWVSLSTHLPEPSKNQALKQALKWTRTINDDERDRVDALISLAPYLPQELLREALEIAQDSGDQTFVQTLIGLALHLPEELKCEATRKALSMSRAVQDNVARVSVLVALTPYLSSTEQALLEVLEEARTTGDARERVRALTVVAPHLPENLKAQVFTEALALARELPDWGLPSHRAVALAALAPHLTDELSVDALGAAREMSDTAERAWALTGLAPHVPARLKDRVAQETLETAQAIDNDQQRAFALVRTVSRLPTRQRSNVIEEAIETARKTGYPITLGYVVKRLAPFMSEELQKHVVDTVLPYLDVDSLMDTLTSLAPHLPLELLRQGQELAEAIKDDGYRAVAVAALAPYLPETEAVQEALDTLLRTESAWLRAKGLANLATHLPDSLKGKAIQEAVAALPAIRGSLFEDALNALAPQLPEWARAHPGRAYSALSKTLRDFSAQPRPTFLPILQAVVPWAMALVREGEKEAAAVEIYQAIQNVARWWP